MAPKSAKTSCSNQYMYSAEQLETKKKDEEAAAFDYLASTYEAFLEWQTAMSKSVDKIQGKLNETLPEDMVDIADGQFCFAVYSIVNVAMDILLRDMYVLFRFCSKVRAHDTNFETFYHTVPTTHYVLRLLLVPRDNNVKDWKFQLIKRSDIKDRMNEHNAEKQWDKMVVALKSPGEGMVVKNLVKFKTVYTYLRLLRDLLAWYADYIDRPYRYSPPTDRLSEWGEEEVSFDLDGGLVRVNQTKYMQNMQGFFQDFLTDKPLRTVLEKGKTFKNLKLQMLQQRCATVSDTEKIEHTITFNFGDNPAKEHVQNVFCATVRDRLWKELHVFDEERPEGTLGKFLHCSCFKLEGVLKGIKIHPEAFFEDFIRVLIQGAFLSEDGTVECEYGDKIIPLLWHYKYAWSKSYSLTINRNEHKMVFSRESKPKKRTIFISTEVPADGDADTKEWNDFLFFFMFVDDLSTNHHESVPSWKDYLNPNQKSTFDDLRATAAMYLSRLPSRDRLFNVDGGQDDLADFEKYVTKIAQRTQGQLDKLKKRKITDLEGYYSDTLFVMDADLGSEATPVGDSIGTFVEGLKRKTDRGEVATVALTMKSNFKCKGESIETLDDIISQIDRKYPHLIFRNIIIGGTTSRDALQWFFGQRCKDKLTDAIECLVCCPGARLYTHLTDAVLRTVVGMCAQPGWTANIIGDVEDGHMLAGCPKKSYLDKDAIEKIMIDTTAGGQPENTISFPPDVDGQKKFHWICFVNNDDEAQPIEQNAAAYSLKVQRNAEEQTSTGTPRRDRPRRSTTTNNSTAVSGSTEGNDSGKDGGKPKTPTNKFTFDCDERALCVSSRDKLDKLLNLDGSRPGPANTLRLYLTGRNIAKKMFSVHVGDLFPRWDVGQVVAIEGNKKYGKIVALDMHGQKYEIEDAHTEKRFFIEQQKKEKVFPLFDVGHKFRIGGTEHMVSGYNIDVNDIQYKCTAVKTNKEEFLSYEIVKNNSPPKRTQGSMADVLRGKILPETP